MPTNFENLEAQFSGDTQFLHECDDYRQEQYELDDSYLEWLAETNQSAVEHQMLEDSMK